MKELSKLKLNLKLILKFATRNGVFSIYLICLCVLG